MPATATKKPPAARRAPPPTSIPDDPLTPEEIGAWLRTDKGGLHYLRKFKALPHVAISPGMIRYSRAEVARWVLERQGER